MDDDDAKHNCKYQFLSEVDIPAELQSIADAEDCIWTLDPSNIAEAADKIINLIKQNNFESSAILKIVDFASFRRPKLLDAYIELYETLIQDPLCEKATESQFISTVIYEKRNGQNHTDNYVMSLFPVESIGHSITYDDVDKLIEYTSSNDFDPKFYEQNLERRKRQVFFGLQQYTPIELAAKHGSIKCFKFLMMNGTLKSANINKYAVEGGNLEIIHILSQNGYDFRHALQSAIAFHQQDIADWILTNYSYINVPVVNCIESYNIRAAVFFLENGLSINGGSEEITPLCQACSNNLFCIAKYLIDNGADVNKFSKTMTPLSIACGKNNIRIVRYLLEKGALPNVKVDIDKTPLTIAIENDELEIVELLIEFKADVNENILLGIHFFYL